MAQHRYRFTLELESGNQIEFDVEGFHTAAAALRAAQRRTADYNLTGNERVVAIRLCEIRRESVMEHTLGFDNADALWAHLYREHGIDASGPFLVVDQAHVDVHAADGETVDA